MDSASRLQMYQAAEGHTRDYSCKKMLETLKNGFIRGFYPSLIPRKQGFGLISSCEMCLINLLHSRPCSHFSWLLLMLLNRLLVTDAAAASLPRISDLFGLCPFKVFPPVRQPRGAQPDRAGRQSGLHEVDGRSRSGRLTRANLGPNHSEDPQPAVFNSSG